MNARHGHETCVLTAVLLLGAMLVPQTSRADDTVVLRDPTGDDHGPGTYVHPAADGFRPGTFDLQKLALKRTKGGVAVTALLAVAPQTVKIRSDRGDAGRSVFMPVIDIYVAADPSPGSGRREVLPGRRITVSGGFGWDRAVVISAVPDLLLAHYSGIVPSMTADVCFPPGAKVVGRSIRVFVPDRCLPTDLDAAYYLVVVTGLGPGAGMGRLLTEDDPRSPQAGDSYVREIGMNPGTCNVWEDGVGRSPCTFGGCRPCGWHPWVLDAIVPDGLSQEALLGDYSSKDRRLAALPFVDARGQRAPLAGPVGSRKSKAAHGPRYEVVSTRGGQVTIRKSTETAPGTIGALVCPGGKAGGTVVVRGTAAGFVVLEKVGDDAPPCKDAEVEF